MKNRGALYTYFSKMVNLNMKKIFLSFIFCFTLCLGVAHGASSDDIYVRRDVFEVEMKNINLRFDQVNSRLDQIIDEIKAQRKEFTEALAAQRKEFTEALAAQRKEFTEALAAQKKEFTDALATQKKEFTDALAAQEENFHELAKSIVALNERMNGIELRFNDLKNSIGDLRNNIYLWLVVIGIIVGLPSVQKFLQVRDEQKEKRSSLTIDELSAIRKLLELNNLSIQK